ncbi:TRAP transporter large permease subunit [Salmonella enterica subsp. enterica]|nr:TRAP transporter large permease subunit [Salmonella enterica subsp. enterica]
MSSASKATPREIWQIIGFRYLLFLPVIIIGGFRSGLFTPTEAGAVAAFYALLSPWSIGINVSSSLPRAGQCALAKNDVSRHKFLVAAAQVLPGRITIANWPMMVPVICCSRWSTLRDSYLSSL